MYVVDGRDHVEARTELPEPGAVEPPQVLVDGFDACLAYTIALGDADRWRAEARKVAVGSQEPELFAVLLFSPLALLYGPPNDEAIGGHPLHARGLKWYSCHEVLCSSWIRRMRDMNRVHPRHHDSSFTSDRHFIITFKDMTVEWVSTDYRLEIWRVAQDDLYRRMPEALRAARTR